MIWPKGSQGRFSQFRSSILGSFLVSFWKTWETKTASIDEVCVRCTFGIEFWSKNNRFWYQMVFGTLLATLTGGPRWQIRFFRVWPANVAMSPLSEAYEVGFWLYFGMLSLRVLHDLYILLCKISGITHALSSTKVHPTKVHGPAKSSYN